MRVLHVYTGNLFGGIESMLATIARHRTTALESEVALCFDGRLAGELRRAGTRTHLLPEARASRLLTVRRSREALVSLLRKESFDRVICHAAWSHAMFAAAVRRAGVPLIFWAHDIMTGRAWTERWARRTPPDLAIGNSGVTAAGIRAIFENVPTITIYPPVDAPPPLSRTDRHALRRELDTPDEAIVIVLASRCDPAKGHAALVDALGRLRDVPNWICWQIGGAQRPADGAYVRGLRQIAARAGIADRVRFAGERDDVPRLLAAADIHCQPNARPDAFGIAFIEALAAGLPVVTTAMGGATEIVDDSCGVLVAPGDSDALTAALRRLAVDRAFRASLASAAPARARALCDPRMQMQRLADALVAMPAPHAPVRLQTAMRTDAIR
jgi:glycosyltransferase involved in cell wall biosynthesis